MDIDLVVKKNAYSPSTVRSMKSVITLLKHNNLEITRVNLINNFNKYIHTLKTLKNKPISLGYKWAVLNTIKRLYPGDPIRYSLEKVNSIPKLNNTELVSNIQPFITKYIIPKFVENLSQSLVEYEVCLLCLVIIGTGLRISEVLKITLSDWKTLYEEDFIIVKSKNLTQRKVYRVDFMKRVYEIDKEFESQKKLFSVSLNAKRTTYINVTRKEYLFKSSESYLINNLNEAWRTFTSLPDRIGPNMLRKFITTMLASDMDLAMMFNMHTNPETTATYYTYIDAVNIDKTLESTLD